MNEEAHVIHSLSLFLVKGIRYSTHLWSHRHSAVRDGIHGDGRWEACNKPDAGCNVLLDESSWGAPREHRVPRR